MDKFNKPGNVLKTCGHKFDSIFSISKIGKVQKQKYKMEAWICLALKKNWHPGLFFTHVDGGNLL